MLARPIKLIEVGQENDNYFLSYSCGYSITTTQTYTVTFAGMPEGLIILPGINGVVWLID